MPLMDQIAEVGTGFQRKAVFPGEFQHVLNSLTPILALGRRWGGLVERLQRTHYHFFGGLVAARAQLPLYQLFATGIEVDVHTERWLQCISGWKDRLLTGL